MSGGILSGIAPLCRFVIVKVLDQKGEANVASILAGLKWVEMNHRKYKIRIVNLSAGAGKNPVSYTHLDVYKRQISKW